METLTAKTRRFFVCRSRRSSMPLLSTSFSRTHRKRLRSRPASPPPPAAPCDGASRRSPPC